MNTYVPHKSDSKPAWFMIDANGMTLGKLAVKTADLLRGRHKAVYTPHLDMGDFVIIINARRLRFSGNKLTDKRYYSHSGYFGHLKETTLSAMLSKNPCRVVELAVKGMLPKNKLRDVFLKKLKIYPDEHHPHEAQKPQQLAVID